MIVTDIWESTPSVVTVKLAVDCPDDTVTVVGTVADELLLAIEITVPLGPEGPLKVTVPVELLPPFTDAGASVSDKRVAGLTVKTAVWV